MQTIDKRTFKICDAVKLGLDSYYMETGKPLQITEEDRKLAGKVIPTLPSFFTTLGVSQPWSRLYDSKRKKI